MLSFSPFKSHNRECCIVWILKEEVAWVTVRDEWTLNQGAEKSISSAPARLACLL